jgi:uncharacterized membrane protein
MSLNLNDLLTLLGASLLMTALVQVLKQYILERWIPLCAVALGIVVVVAAALALGYRDAEGIGNAVLTGTLAGLAAIGVYEVAPKSVLGPKQ